MAEEQRAPLDTAAAQETQQSTQPAPSDTQEKILRLQKELEEALKSATTFKDQLLRKAAEFENFKRRNEADLGFQTRIANEGLMYALLPILDDLQRSLKQGHGREDDPFFKGVQLIHQKFSKLLEQQGLVPFDSVGKPFDVGFHDALLQKPDDSVPHHTVLEEVERGYMLNDRVLRHAKVVVSSSTEQAPGPSNGDVKDESQEAKNS